MYLCLATLWLALPTQLQAQWVTHLTREKLDSLTNPATAAGGETMRFDTRRIETPELHEDGAPTTYTYRWRNDGKEPLVVTRIQTSCGCAKAKHDKRPVPAGGQGEIKVTYHPNCVGGDDGVVGDKVEHRATLSQTVEGIGIEHNGVDSRLEKCLKGHYRGIGRTDTGAYSHGSEFVGRRDGGDDAVVGIG